MRTLMIGLIAATGIALAAPASADSVSVGVGGVGVGIHEHDRDFHRDFRHREFRRDHVTVGLGEHVRHCKTIIVHRDGFTKRIKRCD